MAGVLLSGLVALAWSAAVTAESPVRKGELIKKVSYSTGEAGHKLKWLPYRSSPVAAQGPVVQTQGIVASNIPQGGSRVERIARVVPDAPAKPSPLPPAPPSLQPPGSNDPFKNPFGDPKPEVRAQTSVATQAKKADPPATLPAEPLSDKILKKAPPEPTPGSAMPPLSADEPGAPAKSPKQAEEIRAPSFGQELAGKPTAVDVCPSLEELNLKPINKITNDITAKGEKFPTECPLKNEVYQPRSWSMTTFTWKASGLCSHPAYFEEVHLERYGHTVGCGLQPFVSAAHFFLIVPALPYAMGVCPPCECVYSLGYYRPGSCAPYLLDPLPLSVRGALAEGGVWTGMLFLIP